MGEGGILRGRLAALAIAGSLAVPVVVATAPGRAAAPGAPGVLAQFADTPAEEARLIRRVEEALERKKALDGKLADLDSRLRAARDDLWTAQVRLNSLEVRQRGMEAQIQAVGTQMEAAKRALRDQAIAAYVGAAGPGGLTGLLQASDIGELAVKKSYVRIVSATQAELLSGVERLRDRSRDLLEELGTTREATETERRRVAEEQSRLRSEREAEAAVRHQISVEIANHAAALQDVVDRRDEFEDQARRLEAESRAIAEQLQIRISSSRSSGSGGSGGASGFGSPLSSLRVSSGFGYRVHPIYGSVRLHTGVDLGASTGTPIRAAADGVVVSAGWLGGYGNAVVIDHGGGRATLYAHQSSMSVSRGQEVSKGQVIGRVGCTGACTGPHLHYEVRINGNPVDPSHYL